MKKIIAAVLASACAVSAMAISVSAANKNVTAAGEVKLTASAGVATPAIDVTVPSTVAAVINPYGVPVTVNKVTYGAEGITSPLYTIVNRTTTSNIKVSATASVTVPTKTNTDKSVTASITVVDTKAGVKEGEANTNGDKFLYAYVAGAVSADTAVNAEEGNAKQNATKATNGTVTIDTSKLTAVLTAGDDEALEDTATNKVVFTDLTVTKDTSGQANNTNVAKTQTLMVLGKASLGKDETAFGAGSKFTYGQFQLGGKVNGDVVWGTTDKVTVNLVLNLTPTAEEATA